LDFFSNKTAEFIDLNKRAGLRLGLVDCQLPYSRDKPAGASFVMHPEDSANGSEPQSLEV